jgi:oligopeptide/dipeptide ABC transporter ATP-binding protein
VVFSLLNVWQKIYPGGRLTYASVQAVDTPNPHTAIMRWSRPTPYLLSFQDATARKWCPKLREEFGVSYLFISHDLSVVRHMSDRIAVMYAGLVVEQGPRDAVWRAPLHPYTRALMSAIPRTQRGAVHRARTVLAGDLPDPLQPQEGCRFHPRCRSPRNGSPATSSRLIHLDAAHLDDLRVAFVLRCHLERKGALRIARALDALRGEIGAHGRAAHDRRYCRADRITTACGVRAGAKRPNQVPDLKPA